MFRLSSRITVESSRIGNDKRFVIPDFVTNIEINSSWDTLGDTCTFELPKRVDWEGEERLVDDGQGDSDRPAIFERGDRITVELGYDSEKFQMFEGFISEIDPNSPVKITCQDMYWYLKQIRLDKTYMLAIDRAIKALDPPDDVVDGVESENGSNLRTIGTFLTPLIPIVNGNLVARGLNPAFTISFLNEDGLPSLSGFVPTGMFRYPSGGKDTVANLLEELKAKFDIYFWFRNNVLQVDVGGRLNAAGNLARQLGTSLVTGERDEAILSQKVVWPFHFQRNIISQELNYVNEFRNPLTINVSGTPPKNEGRLPGRLGNIQDTIQDGVQQGLDTLNANLPEDVVMALQDFTQVQFTNAITNNSNGNAADANTSDGNAILQKTDFSGLNRVQLLLIAQRIYNNVRYTGFEGSFTTFGQYPVKHGDIALLTDERNPERNGSFLIRGVNTTFGVGGYRQQVFLERNVNSQLI